MKRKPTALARAVAIVAVGGAWATPIALSSERPDVHATIIAPQTMAPGAKARVTVELALGAGWHVNSHTPSQVFLIPTDLALTATAGALSPIRYPADVERRFAFSETPLRVYEGTVVFETEIQLPEEAAARSSVAGTLSYQACNDRQCFAPAEAPLAATIAIARAP